MKQPLITIAAVVLVGCGESQQSVPQAETKPVEPVAEASTPEPPTVKAPDISIHDAAMKGNIEAVKQHLAAGTDVNIKTDRGLTPLHYANNKETIELLLAKGADVNAMDADERSPLHYAAERGFKEIAKLLIAKGADVNAKDVKGDTPLDWGVDITVKDKKTNNPQDWGKVEIIADFLRKHGGKTGEELKAVRD